MTMAATNIQAATPDSVYLHFYNTPSDPHKGIHIDYSTDQKNWTPIGKDRSFVTSDYGPWGSEKRMFSPSVIKDGDTWYAVWQLGDRVNQFATTLTKKLSVWKPQDYPYICDENGESLKNITVLEPILTKKGGLFTVTFKSGDGSCYKVTSRDFKKWSSVEKINLDNWKNKKGDNISTAPWDLVENLINRIDAAQTREAKYNESMRDDSKRFAGLKDVKATMSLADAFSNAKDISPMLIGIFFEDINYAADGGLYAEMIQNRDFEYTSKDNGKWNSTSYWTAEGGSFSVADTDPIHKNNSHYAVLSGYAGTKLINEGFAGIAVRKGEKYDLSLFSRGAAGGKLKVSITADGKTIAQTTVAISKDWKQQKAVLTAKADSKNARLTIELTQNQTVNIDFVSLFPQKTFKGRKNGMRQDLAQTLADMHPRFVRFPGGCLSHGNGLANMYHWKNTIGQLWERKGDFNIWHYHQSLGLGFYEYFQFCEDIGAEPLPVLPAGVPCQNSSVGGNGQQGGLPFGKSTEEGIPTMEEYLQELLDLIEWANGDPKTSEWARMRAEAGHPKPFNLKYLGVGNEDLISDVFEERFAFLNKGIKAKYPDINIVGTVGPFFEGSDYEYGWQLAKKENIDIVDEHYYVNPGWYIQNQKFYDKYDRKGTKVYLGEWASRSNRLENALAEALHITNLERNADVVTMSSYAPLFGREGHCQWNPDMIYFNNTEVKPAPSYYTQMLAGQNSGIRYLPADVSIEGKVSEDVTLRVGSSVVEAENGDLIIKLVNLLPEPVDMGVSLGSAAKDYSSQAKVSVLTGKPDDKSAQPTYSNINIGEKFDYKLPAYSFSVIRLSK